MRRRPGRACTTGFGSACPGSYNVANCLLALALLDAVGVSPEQAAPGLRTATVPGRLRADRARPGLSCALVDYAHKPGALRAVLETLRGADHRPARRGVRGRRQPRPRQARADGRSRRRTRRSGGGHRRQPARRGSRGDPRRDPGRRVRQPAGAPRSVEIGDRRAAIDHAVGLGASRRRGADRRQGPRGGPDRARPDPAVRRPRRTRGGAGGPAR